ncbi:Rhodanese-related sulfurtransferase [hydrothermal vent metagenome]|uniref:Rhodanese-related sulfurtransferase n=1 Tax=hydrothermal vent metagenome TaxID=652676 RepID=A0A3B1BY78_9ZZZZ
MTTTLKELSPTKAWELLQANPRAVLIDIRSTMEFLFVGHPDTAVHLAWIDEPDWEVNPHFVPEARMLMLGGNIDDVEQGSAPVILICRSGKRSKEAGKALIDAGFSDIYHVDEGFEGDLDEHHQRGTVGGWRYHKLPWVQC